MHRKQISRALIGLTLILDGLSHASAKPGNDSTFSKFNHLVTKMEAEIANEKSRQKRYEIFLKKYREISVLRKQGPRDKEENEIHMSYFMDTLSFLPEESKFQEKNCAEYKKTVIKMTTTYSQDSGDKFVDEAKKIVNLLCQ